MRCGVLRAPLWAPCPEEARSAAVPVVAASAASRNAPPILTLCFIHPSQHLFAPDAGCTPVPRVRAYSIVADPCIIWKDALRIAGFSSSDDTLRKTCLTL